MAHWTDGQRGDGPCPRPTVADGRSATSDVVVSGRTSSGLTSPSLSSRGDPSRPASWSSRSVPARAPAPYALARRGVEVIAIERDPHWAATLRRQARRLPNLSVVEGDTLAQRLDQLAGDRPYRVVGVAALRRHHCLPVPPLRRPGPGADAVGPHRPVGGGSQTGAHASHHIALDDLGAVVDLRRGAAHPGPSFPAGARGRRRRPAGDPAHPGDPARTPGRRVRRLRASGVAVALPRRGGGACTSDPIPAGRRGRRPSGQ